MMQRSVRIVFILAMLIFNVGCDQLSKKIARSSIADDEAIEVIKGHVTLTKVENTGAFLSVGSTLPEPFKLLVLTILPILILASALYFLIRKDNISSRTSTGLSFMIGGGIGNIYDRIFNNSVTDFIHIDFGIFQTGIFNMADVSIMAGIFIILTEVVSQSREANSWEGN